jgi:hypothetical protein
MIVKLMDLIKQSALKAGVYCYSRFAGKTQIMINIIYLSNIIIICNIYQIKLRKHYEYFLVIPGLKNFHYL